MSRPSRHKAVTPAATGEAPKIAPDAVGEAARPAAPQGGDLAGEHVVPATEPLPSDQIGPATEPVAAPLAPATEPLAPATEPLAPTPAETAPLPAPGPAPTAEPATPARPAFEHVPGTEPLPSDQLTPVRRSTAERSVGIADVGISDVGIVDVGPAYVADPSFPPVNVGTDADVLELLRRDLDAAGFGPVILAVDTVDLLRRAFDLSPIAGERGLEDAVEVADERRWFRIEYDVEHDGRAVAPGGRVFVTYAQFVRLSRGTAIAADRRWSDGESL